MVHKATLEVRYTIWRDGRVDECDGLENRNIGNGIGGSNPSPSAAISKG